MNAVGACPPLKSNAWFAELIRSVSLVLALGFVFLSALRTEAQPLAAEHRIHLDPAQFNLEGLSPGPARSADTGLPVSRVFWSAAKVGPIGVTIRQYTDGSMTVTTPVRTETITVSQGTSTSLGGTSTSTVSSKISIGGAGEVGSSQSVATTKTQTASSSAAGAVTNSLTFRMEGTLLIAVVTYTVGTVTTTEEISLGLLDLETGAFTAFATGFLEGKNIVKDRVGGELENTIVTSSAPATTNPLLRSGFKRGWVDATGESQGVDAWVLTGYFVEVATVNGRIIEINVTPEYEYRPGTSFRVRASNPYLTPGGRRVLY